MSHTDRFTSRAGAYVAGRPSYPAAAIDAIMAGLGEPSTLTIADLGAGTGISSRALADRGARVLALEPNAAMRAAARSDSRIEWIGGTAERTTLPDRCVEIVTAFQAWHWFDAPTVTAEVRRILRPCGRLAVVYNERDESDALTAGYGDIVRRHAMDKTERRRADAVAHAVRIDARATTRTDVRSSHSLDRSGVHARAASSSYLPQSGPQFVTMHAEIDELFDRFGVRDAAAFRLITTVVCVDV